MKVSDFAKKLVHIPLNSNQGLIWTNDQNVCNSVVAIYSTHTKIVVVRPEWRELKPTIVDIIGTSNKTLLGGWTIKEGDSFAVDTWDNKVYGE
jgi:hypothetical protein